MTAVQVPIACPTVGIQGSGTAVAPSSGTSSTPQTCTGWQEQVEVVDVSNGGAKARGTVTLPVDPGWYWDWAAEDLFVVDLSNPDAPAVSSTVITQDPTAWWGNMQVVGNTLYTTHYAWVDQGTTANPYATIRYYLDSIDLSDRSHPRIGASINVPGILVGGSASDPNVIYTIDYQWNGSNTIDTFNVLDIQGNAAYLQSSIPLDGWVGNVIVSGTDVYTSTQVYSPTGNNPPVELHQIDVSNPRNPVDQVASGPQGWGWLLGVQGDRMLVTTGWNDGNGMDVYKLSPNAPPAYDQFVRTQGWSISSIARQNDTLYLSSGDCGVQVVNLN